MPVNPYTSTSPHSKWRLFQDEIKNQGIFGFVLAHMRKRFGDPIAYWFANKILASKSFVYHGQTLRYFVHPYNFTWTNERAIEIPIFQFLIRSVPANRILEIGNVLSHYEKVTHDVVDKYEHKSGVINEDVISFHPKKKYDLIIAISTLEHVGWHETPYAKNKILPAIENLHTLLFPGGKIVFSVPIGINKDIDRLLKTHRLPVDQKKYFKRISASNLWIEVTEKEALACHYNTPYSNANAILIAQVRR